MSAVFLEGLLGMSSKTKQPFIWKSQVWQRVPNLGCCHFHSLYAFLVPFKWHFVKKNMLSNHDHVLPKVSEDKLLDTDCGTDRWWDCTDMLLELKVCFEWCAMKIVFVDIVWNLIAWKIFNCCWAISRMENVYVNHYIIKTFY